MKIALGQINVKQGQPTENLAAMREMIAQAKAEKADLIVFPEMALSGYCLQDKWLDQDWCAYLESLNDELLALSQGIGILYGNLGTRPIGQAKRGRDGRPVRYNAAYFCADGQWVKRENSSLDGLYIKHLNPDYRVFDDSRYFLSGMEIAMRNQTPVEEGLRPFLFEKDGQTWRIGVEICEDLWSEDYALDVTDAYLKQDVDLIVNLSCSSWTLNKERSRDKRVRQHAASAQGAFVPLVYVNACGMQNNGKNVMVFDGDSTIYDEQGERQLSLNDQFEPECRIVGLHEREVLTRQPETKLMRALVSAIREFDKQMFSPKMKWIVGLSGGLDSSITSALLVYALGAQRVVGYNMASRYNSLTTKNNAKALAERLGILIREGSIEKIVDATVDTLQDYGYPQAEGLALENIQARLRGHLLSSFASMEGGVIVNNGNKVEAALGYCTLYGDAIGALSPIADCTKVQLFDLAKQINAAFGREIIPANLLPETDGDRLIWEFPPSAELKDDQRDPMKWFYHDWLINRLTEYPGGRVEEIMDDYLQGRLQASEIGQWLRYYGLDDPQAFIQDLEWVLRTMQGAVFKRIQFPPLILISRGAFGSDVREAQMRPETTKRYRQLREQILAMPKPC